jgi:hypothetical protein
MQRKSNFRQTMGEILDPDRQIPHRHLPRLSNLSVEERDTLRTLWPQAPTERRQRVARALLQLTEDNLDLNFRDVFLYLLEDEDEQIRITAIEGLWDDESSVLLEQLVRITAQDPSMQVRQQAVLSLGRFAYQVETTNYLESYRDLLLNLLLGILRDESTPLNLRRRAIESVSYLGQIPEVEQAIDEAYHAPERRMRVSAVRAMGRHMAPRWRACVEQELTNQDPEMRYEAAYASGELGEPEFVVHLAPLLEDNDHEVVRAAIWALGEIGGKKALRLLEQCLKRQEADIRMAAEEALHTLRFFQDPMEAPPFLDSLIQPDGIE